MRTNWNLELLRLMKRESAVVDTPPSGLLSGLQGQIRRDPHLVVASHDGMKFGPVAQTPLPLIELIVGPSHTPDVFSREKPLQRPPSQWKLLQWPPASFIAA